MEIGYYELAYDDIEQISCMEQEFFSVPWSEASIAHYAEAGNTIFVVARSNEDYVRPEANGMLIQPGADGTVMQSRVSAAGGSNDMAGNMQYPKKVVGYIAIFCAGDEGNLVSIGVNADYREMGIATELLDIAYEMALDRGVTSINLEVRESNTPAIRLYEQEGFERVGKRPGFYRNPTEDALIYVKTLQVMP